MSKADEMFKKLGYIFDDRKHTLYDNKRYQEYWKNTDIIISFDLEKHCFKKYNILNNERLGISMQELKAINEKVKELEGNE